MNTLRLSALLLALTPSLAQAHAVLATDEATVGQAFKASVGIGHGCGEGAATDAVVMQLPAGFLAAKPMPKPGWQLEVIEGDYAHTYTLYGEEVRRGPVEIRWVGGSLDDRFFDEFTVRGTFDASLAGQRVAFPTTQRCGAVAIAWTEIAAPGADPHALEHPAPTVTVAAAASEGGGHAHHHGAAAPAAGVSVEGGYARAMLPGAQVGGGYLTVSNGGATADRLVSASSPRAGAVSIHESSMEGGVMRMRMAQDGLMVPAGGTLQLDPAGAHLMFEGVAQPFREGESVPVTLQFEQAGAVEATLQVGAPNAAGAPDPHAAHAH